MTAEPIDFRSRILRETGARPLSVIPRCAPDPLLLGWLDPAGHTIVYGDGSTGKGVKAADLIRRLVGEGHHVLILDYENHPDEWSRRVHALQGSTEVVEHVTHVSPTSAEWTAPRGGIWEHQAEVKAVARIVGATYMVVDSLAIACGGADVLKPEAATQYAAALSYIGLPTLSLGHVTKEGDQRYTFGSIYFHNLCRVSWSATKVGGDEGHNVLFTWRKGNNYRTQGRRLVSIEWVDDLPRSVTETSYAAKLADLIEGVLGDDRMTVARIVARLAEEAAEDDPPVKRDSVHKALKRGVTSNPKRFTVTGSGDQAEWSRAA